jgi:hypothetical protein
MEILTQSNTSGPDLDDNTGFPAFEHLMLSERLGVHGRLDVPVKASVFGLGPVLGMFFIGMPLQAGPGCGGDILEAWGRWLTDDSLAS